MKYAIVVGAFFLGMCVGPIRARAGMAGTIKVTETPTDGLITVYGSNVVGFSCAMGKENMHCYVASAQ